MPYGSIKCTKKINLKEEERNFKKNGGIIFSWIVEKYEGKKDKLYFSYDIVFFNRFEDREVFHVLAIFLGLKTKIEVDEVVVRMAYNIIEAHICYDFALFFGEEIKKTLLNVEQGDFWHSSYL